MQAKRNTPMFLYHGKADPEVLITNTEKTYEYFMNEIYTDKYESNLTYITEENLEHSISKSALE